MNQESLLNQSVVLLDSSHNKQEFDCGIPVLNEFLHEYAGQTARRHQTKTYVLLANDCRTIIGYFTLGHARFAWHERVVKAHQRVDTAGLIARLAVDVRFQGQGLGRLLLRAALEKWIQANEIIAIPIIVVDAKDGASQFYEQFGFQKLDESGNRLFLLMETLLKAR